jgi:predicted amidohydrolase
MRSYVGGTLRTFTWNGICFGVLICNDLWATPGSTTIANPYLAWQLKEMGAEIIFHSVSTGHVPRYRPYHESNQALWAWSLGIPIVTANAVHDETSPTNGRGGVVGADGLRRSDVPDAGEQFFSEVIALT